jgi:hypothetical protein
MITVPWLMVFVAEALAFALGCIVGVMAGRHERR